MERGVQVQPMSHMPEVKDINYYHKIRRGQGYVSDPLASASKLDNPIFHDHLSNTSSWDSDNSVGEIFKQFFVNMTSANHPKKDDEEMELLQSKDNQWIWHLNALWDTRFEQQEPPTEDKII